MFEYLYHISDTALFLILSISAISISISAIFLLRRILNVDLSYEDNTSLGYLSSLVGIIYGVLVGLTALYLINNNNAASEVAQAEANGVADVYHDSNWLKEPAQSKMHAYIAKYLNHVIYTEWPEMKNGDPIHSEGNLILDNMENELKIYAEKNHDQALIIRDMIQRMRTLYDARQQRLRLSFSALNSAIWIVVLIGTVLTIAINYLYRMSFYLHLITVSIAALMASSMIYLLMTLDRPFQGDFVVQPDAFIALLAHLDQNTSKQ